MKNKTTASAPLSSCCNAAVNRKISFDKSPSWNGIATNHYECDRCWNACYIVPSADALPVQQPPERYPVVRGTVGTSTPESALEKAYSELVAAVVKAVPEIGENKTEDNAYGIPPYEINARPITLEDILRAWVSKQDIGANFYLGNYPMGAVIRLHRLEWTLGKPLSEQSDELKLFLRSLLVP